MTFIWDCNQAQLTLCCFCNCPSRTNFCWPACFSCFSCLAISACSLACSLFVSGSMTRFHLVNVVRGLLSVLCTSRREAFKSSRSRRALILKAHTRIHSLLVVAAFKVPSQTIMSARCAALRLQCTQSFARREQFCTSAALHAISNKSFLHAVAHEGVCAEKISCQNSAHHAPGCAPRSLSQWICKSTVQNMLPLRHLDSHYADISSLRQRGFNKPKQLGTTDAKRRVLL